MIKEEMIKKLHSKFTPKNLEYSIYEQSNKRTYLINELTNSELENLFFLFFPNEKPANPEKELINMQEAHELKRLRSIILNDAQIIGIYKTGDWSVFNRFMLKLSVLKKPLNQYEISEFPMLIKQFKSMRYKFEQKKTEVGSKSWYQFLGLTPSLN